MNKSDIYKIIGYNGEYNNNVKKALRKLLKENHPDTGGNVETFKVINEVKNNKELEDNKVSFHVNKKNSNKAIFDDIDYTYCSIRKKELESKKMQYQKELNEIKKNIKQNMEKYGILYQSSIDKEHMLYNINDKININIIFVISIILVLILGLFIITKRNALLIIFIIMLLLLLICIYNSLQKIKQKNKNKNIILNDYFNTINDIKISKNTKKELINKKIELERKINKINNDIRFYDNILKKE